MTVRALAGLIGLNVFFVVVGAGVLWGLRGWRWWTELFRLAGVAYLLGVASVTTVLTIVLVAGIPFGWPVVVLTGCTLTAGGVLFGWRKRLARPLLVRPGWRPPRVTFLGALWVAAIVLYFEALFRSGRLAGLSEWDAWRCWTLRAKAIFYTDGLDRDVFSSPQCPGYPPGFSTLEAAGFHAMGSVDVVTVHLQYWFLAAGFIAALAGLLAPRVRHAILLPFLLLLLVLPSVTDRVTDGRADLPLAYLVGVGAVLIVLWLEDRHSWRLPAATILFAGALLTKREGLLLVAFVVFAALVASWRGRRSAWPRLVTCFLAALALSIPWRIWLEAEKLKSGAPAEGYLGIFDHLDRAWPSLWLVVRTLFDYEFWLLVTPLALGAAALALLGGARRPAVFVVAFTSISVIGCTWAIWAEPDLEITQDYGLNPVVRLLGGAVLALAAVTPFVLEQALTGRPGVQKVAAASVPEAHGTRRWRLLPWAIVVGALIGYPTSTLVGYSGLRLPDSLLYFPSPDECVVAPVEGQRLRVVLGYTVSYPDASELRDRASRGELGNTEVAQDGCGRLRVFVDDIPSMDVGERVATSAVALGFRPTLEHDPDR